MLKLRTLKKTALAGVLIAGALLAVSCNIGFGGPALFTLPVPWLLQQNNYYCAPASIQMWALFDGNSVLQVTIANYVGTVSPDGTLSVNVAPGVDHFTLTRDAQLVDAFFGGANYYSRQITSLNNMQPFIGVFDMHHVVVVNGGAWHTDDSTGLYVWDTVLYQDPAASRPSLTLDAGTWMELNSAMVIGASASGGATAFLDEYGPNVVVRGSNFRYLLPKNN
jgi:hypothetical protein